MRRRRPERNERGVGRAAAASQTSTLNASSLRPSVVFALIVLAAAALLLFRLGEKSLWLDEAFSVVHAKLAPGAIIARAFLSDPNQVLYFFILHFWIALGEREFTLRLPSAIFALGTVPSVYLLAKRLFGRWPGVVAAAALALNAFFIHFGQEARGYSLTLLLVTLQILFFIRALETRGWTAWVAYAAAGAGACYVHVFSLIAPAIHLCAVVWRPPAAVPWRRFFISLAGLGLATSPIALLLISRDKGQLAWLESPSFGDFVAVLRSLTGHTGVVGACVVIAVALLGAVAAHRVGARATAWEGWGARLALLWLCLPLAIFFVVSQFKPIFLDRYLLFTLPGLILLIAAASTARPRWLGALAVVLAFAVCARGVVFWFNEYNKEHWRAATRRVIDESRPGDAIAFVAYPGRVPFEYYLRQSGGLPPGVAVVELASSKYLYGGVMPPPNLELIRRLDEKHPRVWLVQSHFTTIPGKGAIAPTVRAELSVDYFEDCRSLMPGVIVARYRRRADAPEPLGPAARRD